MGKKKESMDKFFDPGYGMDPYSLFNPFSSSSGGSSWKGSASFDIGGKVKLQKGDSIGVSAFFRDFDLSAKYGKETVSLFSMKGEGEFDLSAFGSSEANRASARSNYHGRGVKDFLSAIFAEYKEGNLGQVKKGDSEETEITNVKKSNSALAQGYAHVEKGSINITGWGSVEAGSGLSALKELTASINEESKGKAQAIAQLSKSAEGREIMQRLGGAAAQWNISGGQLNVRKQVMLTDG